MKSNIFKPDANDSCPCASGETFASCCRPVFREISNALAAAEEGYCEEAVEWMEYARDKAGDTPEILCRYAVVCSYFEPDRADDYLDRCLDARPAHPTANFYKALSLKRAGDLAGAEAALKTAIAHFPPEDATDLGEAWRILGAVHYEAGDFAGARAAWETALKYLPDDAGVAAGLKRLVEGEGARK